MLRFLFPLRFRQWLGPLLVAGGAGALLAIVIVVSGIVDLSAAKPHPEGWARFLHYTFDRSTRHYAAGIKPPGDLGDPIRIAAGAAYYGQVCAHCHAGPGLGQNPVALSMHPRPQYLVTDLPMAKFTDAELFRIVKAGVKYSAMPSWPADGRDDEIWQLVAFLKVLPTMAPEAFRGLAIVQPRGVVPDGEARGFGASPHQTLYTLRNNDEPPVASYNYRTPAFGFSNFALTSDPVTTCAQCHGADGIGGGAFPNLTLQDRDYLARTLWAFAHGQRRSGFMQVVASGLSPRQIGALADYYSALPRKATDRPAAFPAEGQTIALVGEKSIALGPCAGCHGVNRAAGKAFPQLEGQSRWYLANQMRVFQNGGRGQIEGENPMVAIAKSLNDAQIQAVSAYYAAQPPAIVQSFAAVKKLR